MRLVLSFFIAFLILSYLLESFIAFSWSNSNTQKSGGVNPRLEIPPNTKSLFFKITEQWLYLDNGIWPRVATSSQFRFYNVNTEMKCKIVLVVFPP